MVERFERAFLLPRAARERRQRLAHGGLGRPRAPEPAAEDSRARSALRGLEPRRRLIAVAPCRRSAQRCDFPELVASGTKGDSSMNQNEHQTSSLFGRFPQPRCAACSAAGSRTRENASPEVVYEQAIEGRVTPVPRAEGSGRRHPLHANQARGRRSPSAAPRSRASTTTCRRAVRQGRDDLSLTLIARKQALFEELERAEDDLAARALRGRRGKAEPGALPRGDPLAGAREESDARDAGQCSGSPAAPDRRSRVCRSMPRWPRSRACGSTSGVVANEARDRPGARATSTRRCGTRLRAFRDEARRDAAQSELDDLKRELGQQGDRGRTRGP